MKKIILSLGGLYVNFVCFDTIGVQIIFLEGVIFFSENKLEPIDPSIRPLEPVVWFVPSNIIHAFITNDYLPFEKNKEV